MKAFVLVLVLAAAACSGDPQVVLELPDDLGTADRIDILLLEPVVLAKEQVHNATTSEGAPTLETVYYMAERSRTTLQVKDLQDREGPPQIEIRGAGGRYVPLVMTWAGENLLALGVYAPARIFAAKLGVEHGPDTVDAVSDVTIYPIRLEPVIRVPATVAPQPVKPGEVMEVQCGAGGPLSGFVWRLADGHELRVLVALPGKEGARLEPPDLDCDGHSPGRVQVTRGDVGDQRDCDDTAVAVHAGARERCARFDEDCNPQTAHALAQCDGTAPCPGATRCVCENGGPATQCVEPIGPSCTLPGTISGQGSTPCAATGALPLPLICQAGCEVLIAWLPEGLEVALSDAEGGTAYGPGRWAPMTDDKAFLSARGTGPLSSAIPPAMLLRVRVGATDTPSTHVVRLNVDGIDLCGTANPIVCVP